MVPTALIAKEVNKAGEPKDFRVIDGADHFWWGFEEQLGEMVAGFFRLF